MNMTLGPRSNSFAAPSRTKMSVRLTFTPLPPRNPAKFSMRDRLKMAMRGQPVRMADLRHNPDLDAAWGSSPPPVAARPAVPARHNPELDALFDPPAPPRLPPKPISLPTRRRKPKLLPPEQVRLPEPELSLRQRSVRDADAGAVRRPAKLYPPDNPGLPEPTLTPEQIKARDTDMDWQQRYRGRRAEAVEVRHHGDIWLPVAKRLSKREQLANAIRLSRGLPVRMSADTEGVYQTIVHSPTHEPAHWGILADALDEAGKSALAQIARHAMGSAYKNPGVGPRHRVTIGQASDYDPNNYDHVHGQVAGLPVVLNRVSSGRWFVHFRDVDWPKTSETRPPLTADVPAEIGNSVLHEMDSFGPGDNDHEKLLTPTGHFSRGIPIRLDCEKPEGCNCEYPVKVKNNGSGHGYGPDGKPCPHHRSWLEENIFGRPRKKKSAKMARTDDLHPDEVDAFHRAIEHNPHDAAPRLIYADWLDEHGLPAHAATIRKMAGKPSVPLLPNNMAHPSMDHRVDRMHKGNVLSSAAVPCRPFYVNGPVEVPAALKVYANSPDDAHAMVMIGSHITTDPEFLKQFMAEQSSEPFDTFKRRHMIEQKNQDNDSWDKLSKEWPESGEKMSRASAKMMRDLDHYVSAAYHDGQHEQLADYLHSNGLPFTAEAIRRGAAVRAGWGTHPLDSKHLSSGALSNLTEGNIWEEYNPPAEWGSPPRSGISVQVATSRPGEIGRRERGLHTIRLMPLGHNLPVDISGLGGFRTDDHALVRGVLSEIQHVVTGDPGEHMMKAASLHRGGTQMSMRSRLKSAIHMSRGTPVKLAASRPEGLEDFGRVRGMSHIGYRQLDNWLGSRPQKKLAASKTISRDQDGNIHVKLHNTTVVTQHPDGTYTLRSGRYHTQTTAKTISTFSPRSQGWVARAWHDFYEGMRVDADGEPLHHRLPPIATDLMAEANSEQEWAAPVAPKPAAAHLQLFIDRHLHPEQFSDDHAAMADGVLANPHDHAPWLIYADWLDEHGDPRAHSIRRAFPQRMRMSMKNRLKQAVKMARQPIRMHLHDDPDIIRAAAANPWDDAPHLILADSMDEWGSPFASLLRACARNERANSYWNWRDNGSHPLSQHALWNGEDGIHPVGQHGHFEIFALPSGFASDPDSPLNVSLAPQRGITTHPHRIHYNFELLPHEVHDLARHLPEDQAGRLEHAARQQWYGIQSVNGSGRTYRPSYDEIVSQPRPEQMSRTGKAVRMSQMDHAAFWRAMAENRKDRALPMIYADWLEDQGKSAHAGLIRDYILKGEDNGIGHAFHSTTASGGGRYADDFYNDTGRGDLFRHQLLHPGQTTAHAAYRHKNGIPTGGYIVLAVGLPAPRTKAGHVRKTGWEPTLAGWVKSFADPDEMEATHKALMAEGAIGTETTVGPNSHQWEVQNWPARGIDKPRRLMRERLRDAIQMARDPIRFAAIRDRGIDLNSAANRIQSANHTALVHVLRQTLDRSGLSPHKVYPAIHDFAGSARASAIAEIFGERRPGGGDYGAAWQGLIAKQPALVVFRSHPQGADSVYKVAFKGPQKAFSQLLDGIGVSNRIYVPHGDGTHAYLYDPKRTLRDSIGGLVSSLGLQAVEHLGNGQGVGGGDDMGRAQYRDEIQRAEGGQSPQMERGGKPVRFSAADIHAAVQSGSNPALAQALHLHGLSSIAEAVAKGHGHPGGPSPTRTYFAKGPKELPLEVGVHKHGATDWQLTLAWHGPNSERGKPIGSFAVDPELAMRAWNDWAPHAISFPNWKEKLAPPPEQMPVEAVDQDATMTRVVRQQPDPRIEDMTATNPGRTHMSRRSVKFASQDEHEAMHAAIAANPEDSAPRLIYADMLREEGHDHAADSMRLVGTGRHDYVGLGRAYQTQAMCRHIASPNLIFHVALYKHPTTGSLHAGVTPYLTGVGGHPHDLDRYRELDRYTTNDMGHIKGLLAETTDHHEVEGNTRLLTDMIDGKLGHGQQRMSRKSVKFAATPNDHEAMHKAILNYRGAPAPKLIYADVLDDDGHQHAADALRESAAATNPGGHLPHVGGEPLPVEIGQADGPHLAHHNLHFHVGLFHCPSVARRMARVTPYLVHDYDPFTTEMRPYVTENLGHVRGLIGEMHPEETTISNGLRDMIVEPPQKMSMADRLRKAVKMARQPVKFANLDPKVYDPWLKSVARQNITARGINPDTLPGFKEFEAAPIADLASRRSAHSDQAAEVLHNLATPDHSLYANLQPTDDFNKRFWSHVKWGIRGPAKSAEKSGGSVIEGTPVASLPKGTPAGVNRDAWRREQVRSDVASHHDLVLQHIQKRPGASFSDILDHTRLDSKLQQAAVQALIQAGKIKEYRAYSGVAKPAQLLFPADHPIPDSLRPSRADEMLAHKQAGLKNSEIANKLGVSQQSVYATLKRAMAKKMSRAGSPVRLGNLADEGFYSHAQRVIEQKVPPVADSHQALRTLVNHGAKPEELKWNGLESLLSSTQGPISKQQLLDHAAAHGVQINEIAKWQKPTRSVYGGRPRNPNEARYHEYTLPGGHNYQEILLQLEQQDRPHLHPAAPYVSTHWDEPNVLAHIRFNSRIDDQGRSLLHIEEIQSDWGQDGRRLGFKDSPPPLSKPDWHTVSPATMTTGYGQSAHSAFRATDGRYYTTATGNMAGQSFGSMAEAQAAVQKHLHEEEASQDQRVPDMPFRKTWHELALRRMIAHAEGMGYDGISWTPGFAQAERMASSDNGTGLRAFYDKIIPDYLNGYGKRFGTRVGSTVIDAGEKGPLAVPFFAIPDAMAHSVRHDGQALFSMRSKLKQAIRLSREPVRLAIDPAMIDHAAHTDQDDTAFLGIFADHLAENGFPALGHAIRTSVEKFDWAETGKPERLMPAHSYYPSLDSHLNWKADDPAKFSTHLHYMPESGHAHLSMALATGNERDPGHSWHFHLRDPLAIHALAKEFATNAEDNEKWYEAGHYHAILADLEAKGHNSSPEDSPAADNFRGGVVLARDGTAVRFGAADNPHIFESVKADPHNDAHWHILADSLEEAGKPHLAELARNLAASEKQLSTWTKKPERQVDFSGDRISGGFNRSKDRRGRIGGVPVQIHGYNNYHVINIGSDFFDHSGWSSEPGHAFVTPEHSDLIASEFDDEPKPALMNRDGQPIHMSRADMAAFARAIHANPQDEAPGLIFADWLDEQGHHKLAALHRDPRSPGSVTAEVGADAHDRSKWQRLAEAIHEYGRPGTAAAISELGRSGIADFDINGHPYLCKADRYGPEPFSDHLSRHPGERVFATVGGMRIMMEPVSPMGRGEPTHFDVHVRDTRDQVFSGLPGSPLDYRLHGLVRVPKLHAHQIMEEADGFKDRRSADAARFHTDDPHLGEHFERSGDPVKMKATWNMTPQEAAAARVTYNNKYLGRGDEYHGDAPREDPYWLKGADKGQDMPAGGPDDTSSGWVPITSSWIAGIRRIKGMGNVVDMMVKKGGKAYRYTLPRGAFWRWLAATSKGSWWHAHVRGIHSPAQKLARSGEAIQLMHETPEFGEAMFAAKNKAFGRDDDKHEFKQVCRLYADYAHDNGFPHFAEVIRRGGGGMPTAHDSGHFRGPGLTVSGFASAKLGDESIGDARPYVDVYGIRNDMPSINADPPLVYRVDIWVPGNRVTGGWKFNKDLGVETTDHNLIAGLLEEMGATPGHPNHYNLTSQPDFHGLAKIVAEGLSGGSAKLSARDSLKMAVLMNRASALDEFDTMAKPHTEKTCPAIC